MKPYRIIVLILLVAFLFGCAGTHQKINGLKIGMTKQEVIETIGDPDTTSASGNVEYLKYRINVGLVYSDEYLVRLLDGKVDAYGQKGDFNLPY
jgi:outer membrane protein assembly factor BamE (lipoprotein component of BamABCDE complex)